MDEEEYEALKILLFDSGIIVKDDLKHLTKEMKEKLS